MRRFFQLTLWLIVSAAVLYGVAWLSPYRTRLPGYHRVSYTPEQYRNACAELRKGLDTLTVKERAKLLQQAVSVKLFRYWEGTRWNFNGTTQTPGQGGIACGYFVMTMLRDAGFDIERSKLSRCSSEDAIKTLVEEQCIHRYSRVAIDDFLKEIRKNGNQLYVVGLDTHIGFLSCENGQCWFIHSGGGYPAGVIKEKAEACNALVNSRYRVTGCLTKDEKLLRKWNG